MVNQRSVTFEKRPVDPKAFDALKRVVAAHDAMRAAEVERRDQAQERSNAISEARQLGLSLEAIGQALGVSRERARQMILGSTNPVRANEEGPGPEPNTMANLVAEAHSPKRRRGRA